MSGEETATSRAERVMEARGLSLSWQRRLLVLLGGLAGSCMRVGLELAWAAPGDAWPWATFTVNLAGAFALGFLLPRIVAGAGSTVLLPLIAAGLLGSLTTFSLFLFEAWLLVEHDRVPLAVCYMAATLGGGLVLAFAGNRLAEMTARRPS